MRISRSSRPPCSAGEALDALKVVRADVILLDVEMPGASGLEALPEIIRTGKGARVLIVSSMAEDGAETTVRALALGAADTLPKPGIGNFAGRFGQVLADRLRRIGRAEREPACRAPRRRAADPAARHGRRAARLRRARRLDRRPARLVRVPAAAAAGRSARRSSSPSICRRCSCPISPASSPTPRAARRASSATASCVEDDLIHVAPGDAHLCVERSGGDVRVRLDRKRAPSGCLPSADPMLDLGRRGLWRRRRRRDAERHGPRRPDRQPAAGRARRRDAGAGPPQRRRLGHAPRRRRSRPRLGRAAAGRARPPHRRSAPHGNKRLLAPHPGEPARGAHRPAAGDEPALADRHRAGRDPARARLRQRRPARRPPRLGRATPACRSR